jgi:hypothetical protein
MRRGPTPAACQRFALLAPLVSDYWVLSVAIRSRGRAPLPLTLYHPPAKPAAYTAGEIDVMKKSSIRTGGTSAVPGPSYDSPVWIGTACPTAVTLL